MENQEYLDTTGTQRVNQLADYVCSVYGYDYGQLADALGVYRPSFGKMRKGGLGSWGWSTVEKLVALAATIDEPTLYRWLLDEQSKEA